MGPHELGPRDLADLIHWKQLPVALAEENGVAIFSGSTVEDSDNTSGLCGDPGQKAPGCLVAIYTGASQEKQTQNVAFSRDGGATWKKYASNPVLDFGLKNFRDPKVFWHAPRIVGSWSSRSPINTNSASTAPRTCCNGSLPANSALPAAFWAFGSAPTFSNSPCSTRKTGASPAAGCSASISTPAAPPRVRPTNILSGISTDFVLSRTTPVRDSLGRLGQGLLCLHVVFQSRGRQGPPLDCVDEQLAVCEPTAFFARPRRNDRCPPPLLAPVTRASGTNPDAGASSAGAGTHPRGPCPQTIRRHVWRAVLSTIALANSNIAAQKLSGRAYLLRLTLAPGDASEAGVRLRRSAANPNESAAEETVVGIDTVHGRIFVDRTRSGKTDWSPDFPARVSAPLKHSQATSIAIQIVVDNNSIEVFAEDGETVLTNLIYPAATSQGLAFYATDTPPGSASARIRDVEFIPLEQPAAAK